MSSIWTIRRSATDTKLTGLCGGVARHWGVDPLLVRVGCVLLALSGGIGLVLYLAGWLLIPVEGKTKAQIDDLIGGQARSWPREAWIAIVAVSCVIAFTVLSPLTPFSFWPAVILALVWYFGYYKNRASGPGPSQVIPPVEAQQPPPARFFEYPGPATPFTEAADAWRERVEQAQRQHVSDPGPPVGQPATPAAASRDYRATVPLVEEDLHEPLGPAATLPLAQPLGAESVAYNAFLATPDPVGLYTEPVDGTVSTALAPTRPGVRTSAKRLRLISLVALGLTLSGLGFADTHGVHIPLAAYFASALLVLGLTLVAATWFGRARGILGLAMLVLITTLGTSLSGPVVQHQGWGAEEVVHTTAAQLAVGDAKDGGRLTVDLTQLDATADVSYTAKMDVGSLQVEAPTSMNVVVNSQVDVGGVVISGQKAEYGTELSSTVPIAPIDPKKRTLTLNLSVDAGVVQVRR